jgi:CAAX prenyl protease-related protein
LTGAKEVQTFRPGLLERYPSIPYVLPFAVFMVFIALKDYLLVFGRWEYPFRISVLIAALAIFSRSAMRGRLVNPLGSVGLGVAVFAIWIGPDLLIPGYREHWLFQNAVFGKLQSSIPLDLRSDPLVLVLRCLRAIVLVPIIEELFWRGFLLRWIILPDFRKVPLGTYSAQSMWIVALLFASEHGPYWDVGLITGLIYNWWMIRTKSLWDCILMHAVTNGALSLYVIASGKWEYWM